MEQELAEGRTARGAAIIVGAGIAGLSTAITIKMIGYDVTVLERSRNPADGAGITIQSQGINVLQELGVLEECCELGFVSDTGNVYDQFFDSAGNPRDFPHI